MPVRAIIKPAIYTEKRFSCACRAITISLKTPSRDIFRRFGGFWRIRCKNRSRVATGYFNISYLRSLSFCVKFFKVYRHFVGYSAKLSIIQLK